MDHRDCLLTLILAIICGCASQPRTSAPVVAKVQSAPATRPWNAKEDLSLDQIQPPVALIHPSTESSSPPPLEAVQLFAQARIAMLDGKQSDAIDLLRKAAVFDPKSFTLHKTLGELYQAAGDQRAMGELEKAQETEPGHLDVQVNLGRQYGARGEFDKAIGHLRLAMQTQEYREDESTAVEVDFLLARALQDGGYDRAALATYERLLGRLESLQLRSRNSQQVAVLLSHPEALALHIASLYEKHHEYGPALKLLQSAAAKNPENFDVHAQLVRDTAATGRRQQAQNDATDLVLKFQASPASLELLREMTGSPQAAIGRLSELHRRDPQDRPVVYALIEMESANNQIAESQALLDSASRQWPDDLHLLRTQVQRQRGAGQFASAAKLLIEALSRRPDNFLEIATIFEPLSRPSEQGRLSLAELRAMSISKEAAAAKLLLAARFARMDRGEAAEREMLRPALEVRPIFAPAWREMLALIWSDGSAAPQQKIQETDVMVRAAQAAGQKDLARELLGQSLLNQDKADAAAQEFAGAARNGDRSSELYLNFATALHQLKDDAAARSILEKLIEQHPLCQEAYLPLLQILQSEEQSAAAGRLLRAWLENDPQSVLATRLLAKEALDQRRYAEARDLLFKLLDEHPSNPEVLSGLQELYLQTAGLGELIARLERRFADQPWNLVLGQALADDYQQQHQTAQALDIADKLREHVPANDPDLLYLVSGLYARLGADQKSEQLLEQVLKLEDAHPGANNDLGFLWADHGKNLARAEELIRKAVSEEPGNASFLDSLGWVLYKRGKYGEALAPLTRAAEPVDQADPIVLDHLGDNQYRLGKRDQAVKSWQEASKRLADMHDDSREEYKNLSTQLVRKQQELNAGKPVSVSPVGSRR